MIDGLVLLTELSLGALVIVLAFRVAALARHEPLSLSATCDVPTAATATMPFAAPRPTPMRAAIDRTDLLTQLHILIGLQERDCREQGLDWQTAPPEVSQFAVAWLNGAACALCERSLRHTDTLYSLVAQIASRKTPVLQPEALQTLATLTRNNAWLACFRHGMDAAEHWRSHRFVPPPSSVYNAIVQNAFI
jgi:hypothetical protein